MYIFQLASQHGAWLAARQALTAGNIANADTPGYKAVDVAPFSAVFDQTKAQLAITHPGHQVLDDLTAGGPEAIAENPDDAAASGNNVSLESELAKAGDIGRMQALDTGLTRVFRRMGLASLKA
jgi:flagellar basal-body rod protein FlgB